MFVPLNGRFEFLPPASGSEASGIWSIPTTPLPSSIGSPVDMDHLTVRYGITETVTDEQLELPIPVSLMFEPAR